MTGKNKQHSARLVLVWLVGGAVDIVAVVVVVVTGGTVLVLGAVFLTDL